MTYSTIKLGDAASTTSGGTPQRGNKLFYGGDIPWIKSGELPDGYITRVEERITPLGLKHSAAKVLPKDTLVIAMYGATVGKLGILGFPAATNQAVCAIAPDSRFNSQFLFYWLLYIRPKLIEASFGGAQPNISQSTIRELAIPLLPKDTQGKISDHLNSTFSTVRNARLAISAQLAEAKRLSDSVIARSVHVTTPMPLGSVLNEVKMGVGEKWKNYPVWGATRSGLSPARERPGKHAERYKPVTAGTVFYNPMRILIGSIAFVDEDDEAGITSPDYVVLKGKPGVVDSRWFYYWLRSPLGERCILSLARGAVRERMLFNRLAEGEIELPDYDTQVKASKALAQIKPMRAAIKQQIAELELLPQKLLAQIFET